MLSLCGGSPLSIKEFQILGGVNRLPIDLGDAVGTQVRQSVAEKHVQNTIIHVVDHVVARA